MRGLTRPRILNHVGDRVTAGRPQGVQTTGRRRARQGPLACDVEADTARDGEPRIVGRPPRIVPVEELLPATAAENVEDQMRTLLRGYRRCHPVERRHLLEGYRYRHMARRVGGVGSVGTRTWIVLLTGRRRRRPTLSPGQAGRPVGARAVRGSRSGAQPRAARRPRPAVDAGRHRHLPRLAALHLDR